MFIGFNLEITNDFFENENQTYEEYVKIGEEHLNEMKAEYEDDLKKYIINEEIDGTMIQDDWFPEIEADIFLSHSHNDKELTHALAGWIHRKFGLKCFIDSNVWGYSDELLEVMNDQLSYRRELGDQILYDHQSCNQVSQHVNMMLSIALQKMIDKVEAVILVNTNNSIKVYSEDSMNKTYSPWIYSEIVCTEIVRKKPLVVYRDYEMQREIYHEATQHRAIRFAMTVSYRISLDHLIDLKSQNLVEWEKEYESNKRDYEKYPLDALYNFMCPQELTKTKNIFKIANKKKIEAVKQFYLSNDKREAKGEKYKADMGYAYAREILACGRCLGCCLQDDRNNQLFCENEIESLDYE